MLFFQNSSILLWLSLVLGFLLQPALGAIGDVFNIKQGPVGVGGCTNQRTILNKWWNDAISFVDAGLKYAQDDGPGAEYMTTFFALDPPPADAAYRQTARENLQRVKDFIEGTFVPDKGKPWLFCSSKWLKEMKWDDIAYDRTTGEKYPDKTKVRELVESPEPYPEDTHEWLPFWSPDLKAYVIDEPGDYCSAKDEDNSGKNFGATIDNTPQTVVTICAQNMKVRKKEDLNNIRGVRTEGKSIIEWASQSLTLFHELFHVVLGVENTPESDVSYKLEWITSENYNPDDEDEDGGDEWGAYPSTEQSLANPETYTLFALACFLEEKSPGFTFASTRSRRKT